MKSSFRYLRLCVIMVCTIAIPVAAQKTKTAPKLSPPTITLAVDASEAPRKIFHAQMTIPATPGTLTLYYPKWIPGEHGPTGPIQDLAGLKFTANGQDLKWRRDLLDGWTIHIEVPAGASAVSASLDFISPTGEEGIYTGGASATDKMTVLSWNTVLLYPAGWGSDDLAYQASLRLPEGWKFGTPLPVASQVGSVIAFNPASLTRLVDSPVIAGQYLRVVPLSENPRQEMDIAADAAGDLDAPQEVLEHYKTLTDQALKLFGAQHFRDYHLLLDEQSEQILGTTDDIAERVRKIGGTTLRSVGHVSKLQTISDNDDAFVPAHDMLRELMNDNKHIAASMRECHELAEKHEDAATAGLLENFIDGTERRTWFLFEPAPRKSKRRPSHRERSEAIQRSHWLASAFQASQ